MREWLVEKRISKGYTPEKLASLLNMDSSTIYKYEKGTRTPSVETAKKIADILKFNWTKFYE